MAKRIRCKKKRKLVEPSDCRANCEIYSECEDIKKWMARNGVDEKKLIPEDKTARKAQAVVDMTGIVICCYCPQCNRVVEEGQHYCWFCGVKILPIKGK